MSENPCCYNLCPWGSGEAESQVHAIFSCPRVLDLWHDCRCEELWNRLNDGSNCVTLLCWSEIDSKLRIKGAFMARCIWGDCNSLVFGSKSTSHMCYQLELLDWWKSMTLMCSKSTAYLLHRQLRVLRFGLLLPRT